MNKYYFSIFALFILFVSSANADLQSNYQQRINLYNQMIEYNESEALQIEEKLKSAFDSLKSNRKSIADLFSSYKALGVAGALQKNGTYVAKIFGAGIAAYQRNSDIPTFEELEGYLETITTPEELESILKALQEAYAYRIQEIERIQKRRDELLARSIN